MAANVSDAVQHYADIFPVQTNRVLLNRKHFAASA
jgi:hypothetical protein